MTQQNHTWLRRPALSSPSSSHRSLVFSLVWAGALLAGPVAAQGDDLCFPEEFSTTNAIYFPFDTDVDITFQWFSLPAQRERVHSFPTDTEVVAFIDAYDLGSRYLLLGTHTMQSDISLHTCFVSPLSEPVQEPVCFGQALERQDPISMGHSPLHRSTLKATVNDTEIIELDGTWTEVGSVSVPARILQRALGSALPTIEFWNTRLEVDPAIFDIPDICEGVSPTPESSAILRELYGKYSPEELRHLPPFRNRGLDQRVAGDSPHHPLGE